jgi:hemolysin activation/secretion protein
MKSWTTVSASLLIIVFPLVAKAIDPVVPDAGSILRQIQPVNPPSPSSTGTGLNIEKGAADKLPSSIAFPVKTILISGNELFGTAALHSLVADMEGKNITFAQLGKVAARITHYYHGHGYPLARAIIPVQTIHEGLVRIEVIEARYGKIKLNNGSKVNDPLILDTLTPLQSGHVIGQTTLDQALLLLADIPGIQSKASLKPGEAVGTSDLLVNTTSSPTITGNVTVNDYGNRYTGRPRAGVTVSVINPLHRGDVLTVNALTSGHGMNYGRISYELLLDGQGTRVGASYVAMRYVLGGSLTPLNAQGDAQIGSLWAKHPLIRGRNFNLYGQVQYDRMELRNHTSASQSDRHLDNGTLSLSGDIRDTLLYGAVNTWNLGWTVGQADFDNIDDPSNARLQGRYSKWNTNLSRLQNLSQKDSLYLAFAGQWAQDNLDTSRKMVAGGPYTVRGYDIGAVSGDTGYIGTAELRHDLGSGRYGHWQAVTFVDSAHVQVDHNSLGSSLNGATLSGAGAGINWQGPKFNGLIQSQLNARAYVATPVGPVPMLVGKTDSVRAWMEIGMGF